VKYWQAMLIFSVVANDRLLIRKKVARVIEEVTQQKYQISGFWAKGFSGDVWNRGLDGEMNMFE